jgi:hypothetical protein
MIAVGTTDTFWGTAAQVGVVITLTAIIEARFLTRQWSPDAPGWVRKAHACFLALSIGAVWFSIVLCLTVLLSREYDPWKLYFTLAAIGVGLGLAVLAPVLRILIAAFALEVVRSGRRTERARVTEALSAMERIAMESVLSNLKTLKLVEKYRDTARERVKAARAASESSEIIEELEEAFRGLKADVKTYKKYLASTVDAFDEAERLPAQVAVAMDKTDRAEAAQLAREQTETPDV